MPNPRWPRPDTLDDLKQRGDRGVACECNTCGHATEMGLANLLSRIPSSCPVDEVALRLRCSACGSRYVTSRAVKGEAR